MTDTADSPVARAAKRALLWAPREIIIDETPWRRVWANRGFYVHPYEHAWVRRVRPRIEPTRSTIANQSDTRLKRHRFLRLEVFKPSDDVSRLMLSLAARHLATGNSLQFQSLHPARGLKQWTITNVRSASAKL
jgi:hypothetical protein